MDDITKGYYIGLGVAAVFVALLMADTWFRGARPPGVLHWLVVWAAIAVLLVPSKRKRP